MDYAEIALKIAQTNMALFLGLLVVGFFLKIGNISIPDWLNHACFVSTMLIPISWFAWISLKIWWI